MPTIVNIVLRFDVKATRPQVDEYLNAKLRHQQIPHDNPLKGIEFDNATMVYSVKIV